VCCGVLQSVAKCCSVSQCVAVCCSVLQCVALRCSVLQYERHADALDPGGIWIRLAVLTYSQID